MVAFVTKSDYLRVARFNVELEPNDLTDACLLFSDDALYSPSRLHPEAIHDRQKMKALKRFLHRYQCFRMLPHECFFSVVQKLQLRSFRPGETLHPARNGILFFLSGECCVHTPETSEETLLKGPAGDPKRNSRTFNILKPDDKPIIQGRRNNCCWCCGDAHDQAAGLSPSTHICTLSGGDIFGESYLLNVSWSIKRASVEDVIFSISQSSVDVSYVVSISIDDFSESRAHYLASCDFSASRVRSILSSKLTCDRTCEQLSYLAEYLTRHSSAKLFFSQFPSVILREICLDATLKQYTTDGKQMSCVQEQGEMWIASELCLMEDLRFSAILQLEELRHMTNHRLRQTCWSQRAENPHST
jgi:hypothetical protein